MFYCEVDDLKKNILKLNENLNFWSLNNWRRFKIFHFVIHDNFEFSILKLRTTLNFKIHDDCEFSILKLTMIFNFDWWY